MNMNRFTVISLALLLNTGISVAGTDSTQEIEFDYENPTLDR
jgi:hypothetical protein